MGVRVLVTRPQPGASRTAHSLAAAGHAPVVLPLTEIVPLAVAEASLPRVDAVVATSANALRHMPTEWIAPLSKATLFAVGAETAAMARERGFLCVVQGPGNAAALVSLVSAESGTPADILYLCGKVRLPDFESGLDRDGMVLHPVETYDTRFIVYEPRDAIALIGSEPVDAVLLYSREAAHTYQSLLLQPGFGEIFASATHICMSERVALGLTGMSDARIRIASQPTEQALLALLQG